MLNDRVWCTLGKNTVEMQGKNINNSQINFLYQTLTDQLNPKHELYLLANVIDWDYFDHEFSELYSKNGRPSNPIRLMVSLLLLKHIYNLSDEMLVEQQWEMNQYFQYFSGFNVAQWKQPCAASDLVYFRQRIGENGVEKILQHSIEKHGKDGKDKHVSVDTTAQEKNITYPTDSKLRKKIIDKCIKIASKEHIVLRRSYKRTVKQLMRDQYNGAHPKRHKKANAAKRKLRTIAGALVRELERKLHPEIFQRYQPQFELFNKVLAQERSTKNKIYSLHEPGVYCMSKGKAHKKYEYGCKASIVLTQNTGIIVGAMTFKENRYDGHTLTDALNQTEALTGKAPATATVDRGYKGKNQIGDTQIYIPSPPKKKDTPYQKSKKRKKFRRRAAIEPIIGHLKQDHRVVINYLKGQIGDSINFILAASAFNFKKLMGKLKEEALWLFFQTIQFCKLKRFYPPIEIYL